MMRLLEKREDGLITSAEIEKLSGWSSHTIRRDISYLGSVGCSAGYDTQKVAQLIQVALGLDRKRHICVVGLGRLGSAFLNAGVELLNKEFELAAGFDSNVNRVEILKSSAPLYPAYKMGEIIRRFSIELALLCVPAEAAQQAAEKLAASGITGILNFAPVSLSLPPEIAVRNVYLLDELRSLAIMLH
ncbi:redox-sensing transcriptional repressor Rex [Spirochaetia bacterium]|nr:redox-sensing transcriptional repressor Rex [Spirochaetia bacterium]